MEIFTKEKPNSSPEKKSSKEKRKTSSESRYFKNKERVGCAKNWIEKYAPEELKFTIVDKVKTKVNKEYKEALLELAKRLEKKNYNEQELFNEFYEICNKFNLKNTEFFKAAYNVLINKDKGPRLAGFILAIGKNRAVKLLKQLK